MRRIVLRGLHAHARIGWTEAERATAQLLLLDLDLTLRASGSPADDLAGTVDYARLADTVAALVSRSSRRLLETLAADVLAEVLRDRLVDAATVTVHKPGAPLSVAVDDVAVVLSGSADDQTGS